MNKMEWDIKTGQKTQAVGLVMVFVLVILLLQLWLLNVAMEEFLARHEDLALPSFLASAGCFLVNLRLLEYVNRIDQDRTRG